MTDAGSASTRSFPARFTRRFLDPTLVAVPIVATVFVLLREHGLISRLPTWVILILLSGSYLVSVVATAAFPDDSVGWRLWIRVGVEQAVIALIIYAIGWGPTLAIGLLFGVADVVRTHGSGAVLPASVCSVMLIGVGQIAIAYGAVPTLVAPPLVHALAVLAALGVVFTSRLLGWVFRRKEAVEANLAASERRFKALVQQAADLIAVAEEGKLTYTSPGFGTTLGFTEADLLTLNAADLVHQEDRPRLAAMLREPGAATHGPTEIRLCTAQGEWRWFEARLADRRNDPDVHGIVANLHDITARRQAEEALREAHKRFRSAFDNAPIGMGMVDLEGHLIRVNPAYGRIVGREVDELCGMNVHELTHPDDREASAAEMRCLVSGGSEGYRIEKRYLHAEGRDLWVSVSVSCVRDDAGKPLYLIGQIEDITERRAAREHLAYAAIHDPLTSLPNRVLFVDRLQTALNRSLRHGGQVAVVFLDLDRFKLVNDSLGHDGGDHVLRAVAHRIQDSVRPSDTVARFGGDEFTVLCEEVRDETIALELAGRVAASLETPLEVGGSELFVTASLGVAIGNHRVSPERLLRDADTAMYRAKERGRASIELFDERDDIWSIGRLRTGNDLHLALQRNELELHYQPFVDLHTSTMVSVEALVRWRHPTRGLLLPADFIDLAEDTGLIAPLGRWVLHEACRQATEWRRLRCQAGQAVWRQGVSINVSPRQLADRGFSSQLAQVLQDTKMDPDGVWLEITESTLLHDPDQAITTLRALRDQGVHISIDDFGTGYSSLSYLQQLPVECLKIDRTFVDGLGRQVESSAIVKAVIALADSLGLACIAEGVETSAQALAVQELGCHVAQGYLFGRPRPAYQLGDFPTDDLNSWNFRPQAKTA